ncbi:MAG: methylenetetrahydrofolate reductase [Candidatus Latescibacteria bacterium]|jgi:methylenetetrahydrofolate reductase (NADPH)|nr:methylenetetrahydrofolate reductase [Candidatus Latescibacterota bacterium]MBT4141090.1 methylenetetrahydrofolate reductase [Candidatus Latescibacterota bacterium]MBT5832244.1 methylenetetrahydrofolate reductase [Candidatus Latescibacterota bacterium]
MQSLNLKEKLNQTTDFLIGVELVSTRGTMSEKRAIQAKEFSKELTYQPQIDWVSITDNAGGNPMLSPEALGTPILYAGQDVMIHLSCKDLNRHGLESRAWSLASHGFQNILALSGDYPIQDIGGMPKPVFDLDSIGLLAMLERMNQGLEIQSHNFKRRQLLPTTFYLGAVTTNFKYDEQSVAPQYLKLQQKIKYGAQFIINQIGYDARKMHEQIAYLHQKNLQHIPLLGNVFALNPNVARLFHSQRIPGVVVSNDLLDLCKKQAQSPDKGKQFFLELAAKQLSIYKGLEYRGAYLGGVHTYKDVETILKTAKTYSSTDWKTFVHELNFSRKGEFYSYAKNHNTGLSNPSTPNSIPASIHLPLKQKFLYKFSKAAHQWAFVKGTKLARLAQWWCKRYRFSRGLRLAERMSKSLLFQCKDCGDCSLSEIAYLCPESQCAKNQRNGPCGGSRDLLCEVTQTECIWSRAYVRLKSENRENNLLNHVPVLQNQALRGTSSWVNIWLEKDHTSQK